MANQQSTGDEMEARGDLDETFRVAQENDVLLLRQINLCGSCAEEYFGFYVK